MITTPSHADLHTSIQSALGRNIGNVITLLELADPQEADTGDIALLPLAAIPAYDLQALENIPGVSHDQSQPAWVIDLGRGDTLTAIKQEGSPLLHNIALGLARQGFSVLTLLHPAVYSAIGGDYLDETFTPTEDSSESCIGHMMCPYCGHRDHFQIEVIGADPDDVDPMESQSRIQSRRANGTLADATYMALFYADGSEDTVSDTEWGDTVQCPSCGHTSTMAKFSSLHPEAP